MPPHPPPARPPNPPPPPPRPARGAGLANPDARPALLAWGVRDAERGWRNLAHLSESLGADALSELCPALARLLPRSPDPDMALNNLERFLAHPAAAGLVPVLLENR